MPAKIDPQTIFFRVLLLLPTILANILGQLEEAMFMAFDIHVCFVYGHWEASSLSNSVRVVLDMTTWILRLEWQKGIDSPHSESKLSIKSTRIIDHKSYVQACQPMSNPHTRIGIVIFFTMSVIIGFCFPVAEMWMPINWKTYATR